MLKYRHVNGIGTEAPHADKEAAQEWSSAPGSQPPYAAISSDETLASDDPRTEKAAACGSAARAGTNKNRYLNIADVRRRHRSTASKPSIYRLKAIGDGLSQLKCNTCRKQQLRDLELCCGNHSTRP